MDGYNEAAKINNRMGKILAKNPITTKNVREWLRLARTVKTHCILLENQAKRELELASLDLRNRKAS